MLNLGLHRTKEVEDRAEQALTMHGQNWPPFDPEAILKRLGITPIPRNVGSYEAILDMRSLPPGLFVKPRDWNQSWGVYRRRLRFTEAHEIGHLVLHRESE